MPAPNGHTLYDFESQLEAAFKDVLQYFMTQSGISAPIYTNTVEAEEETVLPSPRVILEASISSVVPQWGARGQGTNPKQVPVGRFFEVKATVVVTRGDAVNLGPLRGLCRFAFSAGAKGFNASNLPYLQILELVDVSSFPNVVSDDKSQQGAEITFGGSFAVKNDAWPSVP